MPCNWILILIFQAMRQQVEVRNITKKISDLNCKLDTVSTLSDPRENSYIEYVLAPDDSADNSTDDKSDDRITRLAASLDSLGDIKTSKTFPPLCRASMETAIAHLETTAKITTIDYHGVPQDAGGDPVVAEVVDSAGEKLAVALNDLKNGAYEVRFTAHRAGTYCLKVTIFDRPIKDCPLFFDVTEHNPPLLSFGSRGVKEEGFMQPCNVVVDPETNDVYVVDTGNSRVKKLSANLDFVEHLSNPGLDGRSVTGKRELFIEQSFLQIHLLLFGVINITVYMRKLLPTPRMMCSSTLLLL